MCAVSPSRIRHGLVSVERVVSISWASCYYYCYCSFVTPKWQHSNTYCLHTILLCCTTLSLSVYWLCDEWYLTVVLIIFLSFYQCRLPGKQGEITNPESTGHRIYKSDRGTWSIKSHSFLGANHWCTVTDQFWWQCDHRCDLWTTRRDRERQSVTATSGLHHSALNDLWWTVETVVLGVDLLLGSSR